MFFIGFLAISARLVFTPQLRHVPSSKYNANSKRTASQPSSSHLHGEIFLDYWRTDSYTLHQMINSDDARLMATTSCTLIISVTSYITHVSFILYFPVIPHYEYNSLCKITISVPRSRQRDYTPPPLNFTIYKMADFTIDQSPSI